MEPGRSVVKRSRRPSTSRPALPCYTRERFEAELTDGSLMAHDIFCRERGGPSVIVVHEAFGLTRTTLGIAERIHESGMTPVLPLLAGQPLTGTVAGLRNFALLCIRREFGALARNEATPIADWLRALADDEHAASGGRPVGVVGMCFSGGYALAAALTPQVGAVVSSQPAFPAALPGRRRNLGVNPEDIPRLKERTAHGACVRALRFQRDFMSPGVRCEALKRHLPAADAVEIKTWNPFDHSVLSKGLDAPPGSRLARELVATIDFLRQRLTGDGAAMCGVAVTRAGVPPN